jgi:hypothetical protein
MSPTFLVLKVPLEVLHYSGTALFTMSVYLLHPFFHEKEVPTQPSVKEDLKNLAFV